MTKREAEEYINWANGEPGVMARTSVAMRKAVETLRNSTRLLSDYDARLLRVTAKQLNIKI